MANAMEPRVDLLYDPELLTLEVGSNKRIFRVPRGLLCSLSEHFAKAFKDSFAEGQARTITLEDTKEWTFECFIGWMYTKRLFWQPGCGAASHPSHTTDSSKSDQETPEDLDDIHEDEPDNPITWPYTKLVKLYIFADYFDSKGFRGAVMDTIMIKALMDKPRSYLLPALDVYAMVFESLPETSPLYKFFLQVLIFWHTSPDSSSLDAVTEIPSSTLAKLFLFSSQLVNMRVCAACTNGDECDNDSHVDVKRQHGDYWYDLCVCHEHESEEEKEACRKKWAGLKEEYDLVIGPD